LKDRQGVTTQYMSVHGGTSRALEEPRPAHRAGRVRQRPADEQLLPGQRFEVTLRRVAAPVRERVATGLESARARLRELLRRAALRQPALGQGWVARSLALGEHELRLKQLLTGRSDATTRATASSSACSPPLGQLARLPRHRRRCTARTTRSSSS
jgi:hypothetical protein